MSNISRLLRIVSTDFLALHLFCFNIGQHGRQILYFKLHVDGCNFHHRRPHAAVRPQVVHRCSRELIKEKSIFGIIRKPQTLSGHSRTQGMQI